MPLRGGPADKLGNRYEAWWVMAELARMLRGESETVRIEPPGRDKVDLIVATESQTECHQVKRATLDGKWRLTDLKSKGLLDEMKRATAGDSGRFVFVSGSAAPELSELCERARDSSSPAEFDNCFLDAKTRRQTFDKLLDYWNCDKAGAFATLRRIDFRVLDERAIREIFRSRIAALFLANPDDVLYRMRGIVDDSIHRPIKRSDLVAELETSGYLLRQLLSPETAGNAVRAATDAYIQAEKRRFIGGLFIPRSATAKLLERLGDSGADSVITGNAGSGKTAFVVNIVEALRERDWPVAAFRFDRLPAIRNTNEIGEHIGLEESPALVLAAAADAAERPGVLIIDQLDSVSAVSGRNTGALDLVQSLIQEARGARARTSLHVLLVCRAFDWQNDNRLRNLVHSPDSRIDIGELAPKDVASALDEAGFDSDTFNTSQIRLLQLPQNLRLFLDSRFCPTQIPGFSTAKEILDLYWKEKREAVSNQAASADQWMDVVRALCDDMTRRQQLSVAKERLDDFPHDYVNRMTSEGVLTYDRQRYAFGHESVFDYCFARIFSTESRSILDVLGPRSEQHLFRRAQIRQVLVYLRDADPRRYIQELGALLSSDEVRIHIKQLAFALLANVPDPRDEEWRIWRLWITPALDAIRSSAPDSDNPAELAWRVLRGSSSWFTFLCDHGVVGDWLASDNDHLVDTAIIYVANHHRRHPERAIALLEPYKDNNGPWPKRLHRFCTRVELTASRQTFDLVLCLLDRGLFDDIDKSAIYEDLWSMLGRFGSVRLDWAPEFTGRLLRRHFENGQSPPQSTRHLSDFDQFHHQAGEIISQSAASHPAIFVEHMLPVVLGVSELHACPGDPPKHDAVWWFHFEPEFPSLNDAIIGGLTQALADVATKNSHGVRRIIADLQSSKNDVANTLLLSLFSGGAGVYAADAVKTFCCEPWRFLCGFRDSPYWMAEQTITAIMPHSSPGDRRRLEEAIFRYRSPVETSAEFHGYRMFGLASINLLSAIPERFRSDRVKKRLTELHRKFPTGGYSPPQGITGGFVGSPISDDALARMSDDQWLKAMAKYSTDDPALRATSDFLKGGAQELAQALQDRLKADPRRFALLALRIPIEANPVYLEYVLSALTKADIADEIKMEVCRKAYAEARAHCGRALADVLGSMRMRLPTCAVDMLSWLALESDDPSVETWKAANDGRGPFYGGDIHTAGINSVRGRAAYAVRDLIIHDESYICVFKQALDQMVQDNSSAVLSCVAGAVCAVALHEPELGLRLFLDMKVIDEGVFATRDMGFFLQKHVRQYFVKLKPIVARMVRSSDSTVGQAGARVAALAVLYGQPADDLVRQALRGSAHHRFGVAEVAARNIADSGCREWCEKRLAALFDDHDKDVRRKAAGCFGNLTKAPLKEYDHLIQNFLASRAFTEYAVSLLRALEETKGALPDTAFRILDSFFSAAGEDARDIRTHGYLEAMKATKLVFRIYRQHENDEWAPKCLDMIDQLYLDGTGDVERYMSDFER